VELFSEDASVLSAVRPSRGIYVLWILAASRRNASRSQETFRPSRNTVIALGDKNSRRKAAVTGPG
jgi:hypothetical protein